MPSSMVAGDTVQDISSARAELAAASFVCGSRAIPYTIRFSARARGLGMTISPQTGLVVTVPHTFRFAKCISPEKPPDENGEEHVLELIERFVGRHGRWVVRQTERLERLASRIPKRWPYGPTLPYLGEEHRVMVQRVHEETTVRRTPDKTLVVHLRRPGIEGARRLLKRWYMDEALGRLKERVISFGTQMGIAWLRVRVGDQRTRWGSCSRGGSLNFNYRLVMAPPAILDYVVQHELLHRWQPNHSRQFWALMAAYCPAYRDAVAWLKTDGPYLTV